MKLRFIAYALAAGIALCAGSARADCLLPGEPAGAIEFDDCATAPDSATPWRYLALDRGGMTCPAAGGWDASKLFGSFETLPPGLRAYCLYEATSVDSDIDAFVPISCGSGGAPPNCLEEFGPDSMSLTMLGGQTIENLTAADFEAQFLAQSGAIPPLPAAPAIVRLSVVDTEPSGFNEDRNGPGISDHGFSLLNLVRRTACPDNGPCAMQVSSQLGLPLELCSDDPGAFCQCSDQPVTGVCRTPARGGFVGTQSDLAVAIWDAVDDWSGSNVSRLVINLSVGWEPIYGGAPPLSAQGIPVRAVAAALQDASCRGALVIAAAGNRAPGPETFTGPLYPAGWETLPAPSAAQCAAALSSGVDPTLFPVPPGTYRPLVYAAGAIDHGGNTVETRVGGEPRLVAFGDHAVTSTTINMVEEPTAILTGTSVSAAVVSAAAAAAWHYRPAQPGYAVMGALYAAAPPVAPRKADFCLDGGAGCNVFDVSRVNVCDSVNAVCAALTGGACPNLACPTDVPVVAPVPLPDLFAAFAADPLIDLATLTSSATVPECAQNYLLHWQTGAQPAVPCPHLQFYGIQVTPYADGQPSGQACPGCINSFASPGNLFLEISDQFQGDLMDVTLLCLDSAWRLSGPLQAGDRLRVSNIPTSCEPEEIGIAFRTDSGIQSKASVLSTSLKTGDLDDDGVQDAEDNCLEVANPLQLDSNGDFIGNRCDGDLNGDCNVNALDLGIFRTHFFTSNPDADHNGDGIVNVLDLGILKDLFFQPPGPSGIPNACSL